MENHALLRSIPKVDEVLRLPGLTGTDLSPRLLADSVRAVLDTLRSRILKGELTALPEGAALEALVLAEARRQQCYHLRPVLNATGVVLHTNLGRAPLAEKALEAVKDAAQSYSTLEYDLERRARGSRYSHVEPLLCRLTGAEAAVVVNNNAAAVLLVLSALGKGREAIVSRGELVEIGGSFRVPDIMESCGCILREVGTTNKTHLRDYQAAISENTFALMKVHTSNFRVIGFTESVALSDLADLAHAHGLPLIEDLGSGALYPPTAYGAYDEPFVADSLKAGADIVSFSGDKLLGGPQAGIIVGKKAYIDILKAHPLMRAMRVDKMTLAALEATLQLYEFGEAEKQIPVLAMLCASEAALKEKATRLSSLLESHGVANHLLPLDGRVGGGSAPNIALPGWGVAIDGALSPNTLEQRLSGASTPLVGRITENFFCLDVRTLRDSELPVAAAVLAEVLA